MKAAIILILMSVLILSACNDDSPESASFKNKDTVRTTIQYAYNWAGHDYRTVTAIKIKSKDTFKYLVPIQDSVRNPTPVLDTVKLNGLPVVNAAGSIVTRSRYIPILDSAGKARFEIRWPELPKEFLIVDYNKDWEVIQAESDKQRDSVKSKKSSQ